MRIREAQPKDIDRWATLRCSLWPSSKADDIAEIEEYFSGTSVDIDKVFILAAEDEALAGFIEINVRNYAEGSRSPQIPYIEAWYIEENYRARGFGKKLLQAAEKWALAKGYDELASDTTIDNLKSIEIHKKLGFKEKDRIVCFLKKLR